MIRAPLSTTSVLDESAAVVRATVSPWAALLLATSIPYRFMQIVFADRLIELGSNASQYGDVLRTTANLTCAAFLLSLCGRAVYARACRLASESGVAPGREALRVPLTAFAGYVFVASIAEAVTYLLFITGLGIAVGAVLSGLAVGTMELNTEPGIRGPLRRLARFGGSSRIVAALALVFFCAFVVALLNVVTLASGILSLASTVGGWDSFRWHVLLSFSNRRYVLIVIAGALLVIEPFWIAANVLLVRKAGAAESGDDLRVWFEELQRS
ncbi:MAG TPA: hypothetical protein VGQ46_04950 [Thermoanaerobaculia bacterium]|nr:hypothetical protein [Thermoanaerobaculia bacterium]